MFFLKPKKKIRHGLKEYKETPGAVLVDVRDPDEYKVAHIPGSVNVPLARLRRIGSVGPDPDTPVFLYCLSGARADKAAKRLEKKGYTNVKSIGGINTYDGRIERH